jgi:hypothetical protein
MQNHRNYSITQPTKQLRPSVSIETVLQIIDVVLRMSSSQTTLENWSFHMFSQLIHTLALLFPYINSESQLNEDVKYLIVKCLNQLIVNTRIEEKETVEKLVTPTLLAYIISTLIELSSDKEKSRSLRVLSISTLKEICIRISTRKAVAIFLPGIVSALTKVRTQFVLVFSFSGYYW